MPDTKNPTIQKPADSSLINQGGHCQLHGDYVYASKEFMGRIIYNRTCPKCAMESTDNASEIDKIRLSDSITEATRNANIPERYRRATLESFHVKTAAQETALKAAVEFVVNFESKIKTGTGLVFCGRPGTGKTLLACAIANSLIAKGRPCHYVGAWWAIEAVKQGFEGKKTLENILAYSGYQLLVVDEIGRQWGSEAERMIMYQIINKRYEAMRPTIVISNLDLEELQKYLDEATIDRLCENGGKLVVFDWESNRRTRNWR